MGEPMVGKAAVSFLYRLVISPLEYLMDLFFYLLMQISGDRVVFAIIGLSGLVFLLTLPLYRNAERLQEAGRDKQERVRAWNEHIRRTFSGDERIMMRQALYRKIHRDPLAALKGSLSLLLQIPFFIAAYHFLSEHPALKGTEVPLLGALDRPDSLLEIAGTGIHLLPILMTAVNLLSAVVFVGKRPKSELIQPVLLALLFLLLLYDCPSGLVLYWLCNNLLSLGKNLVPVPKKKTAEQQAGKGGFLAEETVGAALLLGLLIPVLCISASPADFVDPFHFVSPWHYIYTTALDYAGLFLLWGGIYLSLLGKGGRRFVRFLLGCLLTAGSLSLLLFHRKLGTISGQLIYDSLPSWSDTEVSIGIFLLIALPLLVYWFLKEKEALWRTLLRILCASLFLASLPGLFRIGEQLARYEKDQGPALAADEAKEPVFHLSRSGKNVVVIMLDRAVSAFIPYIMEERPELPAVYSGFTWYPNTLSFGGSTRLGAPAVYGGYEYSPAGMHERQDAFYIEKTDEALLLLPKLFAGAGYEVVMSDDPLEAHYHRTPWEELYAGTEGVSAIVTDGKYADYEGFVDIDVERNFVFYSLFRALPPPLAAYVYGKGGYMSVVPASDVSPAFWNAYSVLDALPELTDYDAGGAGSFIMLANQTTHSPCRLQLPDYIPSAKVDNRGCEAPGYPCDLPGWTDERVSHYHVNMASLLALGRWIECLKAEGVYENTRIILAADHGTGLGLLDVKLEGGEDATRVNPLLLVKDFGDGEFGVSEEFMTNADVPSLALEGIVEEPVNPFTGRRIDGTAKNARQKVFFSVLSRIDIFDVEKNGAELDTSDGNVYSVGGNIFDENEWKLLRQKTDINQ
ncbi:MAG: YidC/Oxa1 family membrane protein insertase [Lachnospiraceae bacterium]|nr:YidC/Oxa1 family membrane protein insertase [Lachnospiraceae bacterium]